MSYYINDLRSNNFYDKEDGYGCFQGLYFQVNDDFIGLADEEIADGWTNNDIEFIWMPAVKKYVEEETA
jgi:hypothetical protein